MSRVACRRLSRNVEICKGQETIQTVNNDLCCTENTTLLTGRGVGRICTKVRLLPSFRADNALETKNTIIVPVPEQTIKCMTRPRRLGQQSNTEKIPIILLCGNVELHCGSNNDQRKTE